MSKYNNDNREAMVGDCVVRNHHQDNSVFIAHGGDVNNYYTVLAVENNDICIEIQGAVRKFGTRFFTLIRRGDTTERAIAENIYRVKGGTTVTVDSNPAQPRRYYATKTKSTITEFSTLEAAEEAAKTASSDAVIYECVPVARYVTTRVREEVILTDGVKPNFDL
jgi:hypothetical protein